MKARQFENMGIPRALSKMAKWQFAEARAQGMELSDAKQLLADLIEQPDQYREHAIFGELARELSVYQRAKARRADAPARRDEPAPYRQWGEDLDPQSVKQMYTACTLPVAVRGALMPDAHVGYGLPIGGVLATRDAVIPYAVGVDIACRVKLSVFDMPASALSGQKDRLTGALERETRFGVGAQFGKPGDSTRRREHDVLDEDWSVSPITKRFRDKAATQLGTSGSGNHFVEFGEFEVDAQHAEAVGLPEAGTYLALLSHSGSRGTGASVCDHYSKLAMTLHPELPKEMQHLAWLDLDTHEGQEYWAAMNLMGRYASANHACIHDAIARHLGAKIIAGVENH
ncbi:MAG: RtcB family protein, partial [Rhodospirillales bacterium]|nr:RtcB family protein [Rhodospirillales bacterium]